jgi:D-alanyl-D-alanine carboxypeptidase
LGRDLSLISSYLFSRNESLAYRDAQVRIYFSNSRRGNAVPRLAMPADDLALWDLSLINQSLLSPASYREMFTDVNLKDGTSSGYGLGVFVGNHHGYRNIWHDGVVTGFTATNVISPDQRMAVVVLTNQDNCSASGSVAWPVADALMGEPVMPRMDLMAKRAATVAPALSTPTERRAFEIFRGLQQSTLDRTQLTALCSAYFTAEAIDDFARSLKPLGMPLFFAQDDEEKRGGMTFRSFSVHFPGRELGITTFEEPDGKLEQYLVQAR